MTIMSTISVRAQKSGRLLPSIFPHFLSAFKTHAVCRNRRCGSTDVCESLIKVAGNLMVVYHLLEGGFNLRADGHDFETAGMKSATSRRI